MAQTTEAEARRRAESWRAANRPSRRPGSRFRRRRPLPAELFDGRGITIRYAYPDDDASVVRLAQLDESLVPTGKVLLAEVGDELWAAASTDGSAAVADPFRPSAPLVGMLRELQRRVAA